MSITSVRIAAAGASGEATGQGPLSVRTKYGVTYNVETSGVSVGPLDVLTHFRRTPTLPWIGSFFAFEGEFDTTVLCKKVVPQFIEKSEGRWRVQCEFEPVDDDKDSKPDDNDKLQEDPLLWHDEIDISYTQISIPVEDAIFRGGYKGRALALRPVGSKGPVVNSAMVPYDPPLEKEISIRVIRFTRNVPAWDATSYNSLQDSVNADHVHVNKRRYKFADLWIKGQARIKNVNGAFQLANGRRYYKRTIEVWVNPLGWLSLVLDRGLERRALEGDPDGKGSTISASDLQPGMPPVGRIADADGYPVSAPIMLDGDGQPLRPDRPPVYGAWQIYREARWPANLF
jgi:hypothetical protein